VRKIFKGSVPKYAAIAISQDLLQAVYEGAKSVFPRETILLLRGEKKKDMIAVTDLVVPPLASYGQGFANIPLHMLPIDFSIVGTIHSHPSGNLTPSHADLNHFFGPILMIVGFPFTNEKNVAVYDRNGEKLALQVTKP
jgi:proteasome lid subunit RPN8/RPN11